MNEKCAVIDAPLTGTTVVPVPVLDPPPQPAYARQQTIAIIRRASKRSHSFAKGGSFGPKAFRGLVRWVILACGAGCTTDALTVSRSFPGLFSILLACLARSLLAHGLGAMPGRAPRSKQRPYLVPCGASACVFPCLADERRQFSESAQCPVRALLHDGVRNASETYVGAARDCLRENAQVRSPALAS